MRRPLNNPMQLFVDFICHWKNKEMKQIFLLLIIWLIIFSCKKDASGIDSSWPCDILEDSSATSIQIVGTWKWTKRELATGKLVIADKNIKATFNSDKTFTIKENVSIIEQGSWSLKSPLAGYWALNITSQSNYLNGFILFCNNQILFTERYMDGNANYFEKE